MNKYLKLLIYVLNVFAKILFMYGIIKMLFTFIDFIGEKVGIDVPIALGLSIIAMAARYLILLICFLQEMAKEI